MVRDGGRSRAGAGQRASHALAQNSEMRSRLSRLARSPLYCFRHLRRVHRNTQLSIIHVYSTFYHDESCVFPGRPSFAMSFCAGKPAFAEKSSSLDGGYSINARASLSTFFPETRRPKVSGITRLPL